MNHCELFLFLDQCKNDWLHQVACQIWVSRTVAVSLLMERHIQTSPVRGYTHTLDQRRKKKAQLRVDKCVVDCMKNYVVIESEMR